MADNEASSGTRAQLAVLGTGAAWLLGIAAALELVSYFLGTSSLAEAVVGALIVDIAAGRAGVAWVLGDVARSDLIRRCAKAAGLAAGLAGATLLVGVVLGWTKFYAGTIDAYAFLSALGVIAIAIRDELLLRGVVFRFGTSAKVPTPAIVVFSAMLSGAFVLARGGTPAAVTLAIGTGLLFACIYLHFGGAWPSIAAHATWSLVIGPVTRGSIADLEWTNGDLTEGPSAAGAPAYVAAAIAVLIAFVPLMARMRAQAASKA